MVLIPFACKLSSPINFWVVFGILLVLGAFSGIIQGTVYAMAAGVPSKYMATLFLGSGVSGIFCNILRAITLLCFPVKNSKDPKDENHFL
jgi:hypothetical protein